MSILRHEVSLPAWSLAGCTQVPFTWIPRQRHPITSILVAGTDRNVGTGAQQIPLTRVSRMARLVGPRCIKFPRSPRSALALSQWPTLALDSLGAVLRMAFQNGGPFVALATAVGFACAFLLPHLAD